MINDKSALKMIVDAAQPRPKDAVLDVACGPGLVVCAFAPYAGRVTGMDITPAMLDRARQLAAEQRVRNVDWHQGDVYLLPYAAESFTIVVTRYSFHHLLDPAAALREMARVCAPKGRIVVVDAYAPEDPEQAAEFNRIERLALGCTQCNSRMRNGLDRQPRASGQLSHSLFATCRNSDTIDFLLNAYTGNGETPTMGACPNSIST
jgi:ubiquinone/menaquinone biosynthesis C-methylase UbiE